MTQIITLRAPVESDAPLLTEWENIDSNDHVTHNDMLSFIAECQQLHSHGQQRFVVEANGIPVGTVDLSNLTADATAAYVSIFVDKKYRFDGIGTRALNLLIGKAMSLGISRLGSIINNENVISQALFTTAGFVPVADCDHVPNATVWMLDIAKRHVENATKKRT